MSVRMPQSLQCVLQNAPLRITGGNRKGFRCRDSASHAGRCKHKNINTVQDSPQPVLHVFFVYKAMPAADNAPPLTSKRHISHAGTARMAVQNGLPDWQKQPIGQPAESKAVATAGLVAKTFYTARDCNIVTEAPWRHL